MFMEVPRYMLRKNRAYNFDIYVKIKDTYHLFAAKGACLQEIHLDMLKTRGTKIYVMEEEHDLMGKIENQAAYSFIDDPRIDSRQKAHLMYDSAMESIRQVYKGVVPKTISDVEKNADDMVNLIISDGNVMDNLKLINTSDHFTYQHSVRVGIYATALCMILFRGHLSRKEISRLSTGFFLHDIGMTEVPIDILEKCDDLSPSEWGIIRMHPIWGRNRLVRTGSCSLSYEAISIILSHHERQDGSGYPYNLKGEDIPRYAKICTIADVFESLTAYRPYRVNPLSPFEALQVMYQEMSREFDPGLFRAFVKLLGPV